MLQQRLILFAIYAMVYTIYGCVVTAIGPIILFYSQGTGHDQTYFSFIFFARALGYLMGGSLIKVLTKSFSYHQLIVGLLLIFGTSLIISSMDFGIMNLTVTMTIAGSCCCMLNVLSDLCVFTVFHENQDYWIQLLNLFFGIGGLIGPVFVIYYEALAMRAMGVVVLFCIIPFFFLSSPETHHNSHTEEQKHTQKMQLPKKAQLCLCFLLFLYIAEEVGYAGWIPTYAFKAHVADQKAASALPSIFWIINTIARLILLYMKGTVTQRLTLLLDLLVGSTFLVLVIQWMGYLTLVAYLGMVTSGIFLSSIYALFFSVVQQYGYELSASITANFAMSASLGEGFLVMPIGYLMGLFGYKALIYIIFLFSAIMLLVFRYVKKIMEEDSLNKKEGLMTPLNDMHNF